MREQIKEQTEKQNIPKSPTANEKHAAQQTDELQPTHYAIKAEIVLALRKFLGEAPHDQVALLIRGLEAGLPLTLGPAKQQ